MKTQLSILVKGDWMMKYTSLPIWILSKKPYIGLYIDKGPDEGGELIKLKLSRKPYIIDIEPGEHQFWFIDSNSGSRKLLSGAVKLSVGAALGTFAGSTTAGVTAALAVSANDKYIQDNYMHLMLQEGDLFKISVKPGKKGIVKIQELN